MFFLACGYCKQYAPDYEEAAKQIAPSHYLFDLNCSDEREFCASLGIEAYPTQHTYVKGVFYKDFPGRSTSAIVEHITRFVG